MMTPDSNPCSWEVGEGELQGLPWPYETLPTPLKKNKAEKKHTHRGRDMNLFPGVDLRFSD